MSNIHLIRPKPASLVEKIRDLMGEEGINEAELSRRTLIPQATLHKILAGKTTDPRASTLKILADYFDISIDRLISDSFTGQRAYGVAETQSIPVVSWGEACTATDIIETLTPSNWKEWIVIEYLGEYAFAVSSKPAMEPRFPKGTLLVIDPSATASDGDLVIVQYPGTNEATMRELSADGPSKLLLSLNDNSMKETLDKDIKILGVVAQSRFSYIEH